MAYSESLARRVRDQFAGTRQVTEKNMFGGMGFFLRGNLLVCVWHDSLVVRVGPDQYSDALQKQHVSEFDVTGRAMTGWVLVAPEGIDDDTQLRDWIQTAQTFVKTLPSK